MSSSSTSPRLPPLAAASPPAAQTWHDKPIAAVLAALDTGPDGLSEAEAERRLSRHGPNRLPQAPRRGPLRRFLAQFNSILIYVLLASAAITALLAHFVDAAVIVLVVLINAIIGFIQEGRAEQALDAIRSMLTPQASVVRERRRIGIAIERLVPGDLVVLEAGDRVPADLRIVRGRNLHIDEAILTGESVPVEKSAKPVPAAAPLAERRSMAYSGTLVTAGHGAGTVVATGTATELGRISALLGTVETLTTPLLRQMNGFARRLTGIILAGCAAMFAFGVFARGYPPAEMFMAAVGVAVAAIPEGLPAVMTIALAIGVRQMAARHAIVRRLPAVETLGAVSVICSDKTGTLTRNEMTVRRVVTASDDVAVTGAGYEPRGAFMRGDAEVDPAEDPPLAALTRAALLCNDAALRRTESAWISEGDPMEGALVSLAMKAGLDPAPLRKHFPRADEIPFDAQHRFMATLHHSHEDGGFICLKGAPEVVLTRCSAQRGCDGDAALDAPAWHARVEALAADGQRVLALAVKTVPRERRELTFADAENGFVLLGVVGLIDPPRPEAVAAIAECRAAGIRVKMITGDHAVTALAIARQLGLENARAVATGQDLDGLDEFALRALVRDTDVFARTSPEHKLRLVTALQADGAIVAMTGDGVNDAPALKRADVGVAMGRKGTEAAKEAAEMVLADDNFASIVAAVREGRTVYDNLKKTIGWTLPTNGGESLVIVGAILFGLALPITAVQILWINMVTTVALGLTLAFEPTEPDAMRRPPRRADEPLLSGFLVWRVVFVSVLFMLGAFGMFAWAESRGLPLETARTIVVNTIVVLEIFYLFSVRRVRFASPTWAGVIGTRAVLIGVGAVVALQLAFTYLPALSRLFETRPVAVRDIVAMALLGVALLAMLEIEKLIVRRFGLAGGG